MLSIFKQASRPWTLAVVSLSVLVLCSPTHAQTKYGVNKPLGDSYAPVPSVASEQTRLVLYRAPVKAEKSAAKSGDKQGVVSVYLHERYHTSLQREAFSVICLTGATVDVRTRLLPDQTADINPELDTRLTVSLKGGQSTYLRVVDMPNGKNRIDLVTAQAADKDLADAKQQMHALSRVPGVQPCREAEAAIINFDPNVITFGSDAIFESKRTEIQAISVQGRQELKQIIEKINVKYKTFADVKVHVVGFADDESNEALNRAISLERAKSVRAFFKAQGLRTTALTYEGRGSDEKQKAQHFGLSPRRVEVEVAVGIR